MDERTEAPKGVATITAIDGATLDVSDGVA